MKTYIFHISLQKKAVMLPISEMWMEIIGWDFQENL